MDSPRRHRRSHRSARHRRNAAITIPLGFLTILAGIALALFRRGISAYHSNEFILGVIVFFAGYVIVIAGCLSWVKAKHLNDAILLIGLTPIVLLIIPYVRLILFVAPQLMFVGMIMMPTILLSIIAVLPSHR